MTAVSDVLGGRYFLERLLGRGATSDVYAARDLTTGAVVALKIVRSSDPEFSRRLAQEARALESFTHPGLVRLLDTGEAGDQAYLVMDLVEGSTLAMSLREGALGSRESATLGARLADVLSYVHQRGVVHRDVKPSNILLASNGDVCLSDFGIARLHDGSSLTATGTTMGTVSYMAPEQLDDHLVGPPADVWSLGLVLLECLTGRRVYEGTPSEVLARRLAGPVVLPSDLPVPWRQLLVGMLDPRPNQRYDGAQVAALLATSAFDDPWEPLDADATRNAAAAPYADQTVRMPGAVLAGGSPTLIESVAILGVSVADATRAGGATSSDETVVSVARGPRGVVRRPRLVRARWILGLSVVAALAVALLFVVGPFSTHSTTTIAPRAPKSTTTTTSTVTTTTSLPGAGALKQLQRDVVAGESTGSLTTVAGQTLFQQASTAQGDAAAGNLTTASNVLQQAATTLSNAVASGAVVGAEALVLQTDLTSLATSLGVVIPTTTTTGPPAPGNGNGGPGHGQGNGH